MDRREMTAGVPRTEQLVLIVKRGDRVIKSKPLLDFAETKIVTHAGKIAFIESTVKEKVE